MSNNGGIGEKINFSELKDKLEDKFNSCEKKLFNIVGLKRPFVLKASGMKGRIPNDVLPPERASLEVKYTLAYFYQKLQETYDEFAKLLAERLKDYKNNPGKPINEVNYLECKSYTELDKVYRNNTEFINDKAGEGTMERLDLMNRRINQKITQISYGSSAEVKSEVVKFFNGQIDEAKGLSRVYRVAKQDWKDAFCKELKKAKYGLTLAKKYGELSVEFENDVKPKSCEYNEEWYNYRENHENDKKLTPERNAVLAKMEKPNR